MSSAQGSAPNRDCDIHPEGGNRGRRCQRMVQHLIETVTYCLRVGTGATLSAQGSAPNRDHQVLAEGGNRQQCHEQRVQHLIETITYSLMVGTGSDIIS